MPGSGFAKTYTAVFLLWLAAVLLYAWYDISGAMAMLNVRPSPDLYANDLGFQILVFALSKGVPLLLLPGIVWIVIATVRRRMGSAIEGSEPPASQS